MGTRERGRERTRKYYNEISPKKGQPFLRGVLMRDAKKIGVIGNSDFFILFQRIFTAKFQRNYHGWNGSKGETKVPRAGLMTSANGTISTYGVFVTRLRLK